MIRETAWFGSVVWQRSNRRAIGRQYLRMAGAAYGRIGRYDSRGGAILAESIVT